MSFQSNSVNNFLFIEFLNGEFERYLIKFIIAKKN